MSSMEGSSAIAPEEAEESSPDWSALPDDALFNILHKVASPRSCAHFSVCKKWWSVAQEVQHSLHLRGTELLGSGRKGMELGGRVLGDGDREILLVGVTSRFRNMTSVHLTGWAATDSALDAVGANCPKLLDLSLGRRPPRGGDSLPGSLTHEGVASSLGTMTGLQSLFLHLPTIPLPDHISSLQNLKSLSMEAAAGPLPDSLGALSSLTSLSIKGIRRPQAPEIYPLPASLWQLTGLGELTLEHLPLGLNPFPPELGNLTALRRLSLTLDLRILSDGLTCLCNLEELKLSCQELNALPYGFHNLKQLRTLHLDAGSFRALPPCLLGASDTGETLGLEDLKIEWFRHELTGGLACLSSTLRRLELYGLQHNLPDELGSLSQLEVLTLRCCDFLYELPESLCDLRCLRELHIQGCYRLGELPRALGQCRKLRVLRVHGCATLRTLPEDIGSSPALREVHLSRLRSLRYLPRSLAHAKELQQFTIDDLPQAPPISCFLDPPSRFEEELHASLALPNW